MWYWLFIKDKTNQFIVLSDSELKEDGRWILEDDNYELINDGLRSRKEAEFYAKKWYGATKLKLETRPITLKEAGSFVNQYHRHHTSPQGHKFSIAIYDGDLIVGVIIAGRPVARLQDDGVTLEITRCCVKEVYKNGVSKLYAAVCRVAQAMGYKKVITYTLTEETGISMKASNFQLTKVSNGGSWNSKSRKRIDKHPTGTKFLWTKKIS
ncbi:XF1762 family protein [Sutcliffiella cohnii]|uniref:XF1762 family protein n=1 Tax=Sutcliffiella cohnii TaxID=33932 RepID=UPI000B2CF14E|nr:XF1762 family protein [Sutcliffiella cohnii]